MNLKDYLPFLEEIGEGKYIFSPQFVYDFYADSNGRVIISFTNNVVLDVKGKEVTVEVFEKKKTETGILLEKVKEEKEKISGKILVYCVKENCLLIIVKTRRKFL